MEPIEQVRQAMLRHPKVQAVRIVGEVPGRVVEVHVVAEPVPDANRLVRDLESIAQAMFDVDIDHRAFSVAMIAPQPEDWRWRHWCERASEHVEVDGR